MSAASRTSSSTRTTSSPRQDRNASTRLGEVVPCRSSQRVTRFRFTDWDRRTFDRALAKKPNDDSGMIEYGALANVNHDRAKAEALFEKANGQELARVLALGGRGRIISRCPASIKVTFRAQPDRCNTNQFDGLLTNDARNAARSTSAPFMYILEMRRVLLMSSSGFASSTRKSASLPGTRLPSSRASDIRPGDSWRRRCPARGSCRPYRFELAILEKPNRLSSVPIRPTINFAPAAFSLATLR